MSSDPSQHRSQSLTPPPPNQEGASIVPLLKRRIAVLEQDVATAQGQRSKKKQTTVTLGRGIRRLAALFETLDELVAEADRRADDESMDSIDPSDEDAKLDAERLYKGYNIMLHLVPSLRSLLDDLDAEVEDLDKLVSQIQKGANDARSDDLRRVKEELGNWLNSDFSPPVPFSVRSRADRGLQNDITGRLLCPIEYNWEDDDIRAKIRDGSISIADDLFLVCLYPKGRGVPEDIEKGFLRSRLLVKTYCAIFTSPTSSEEFEDVETEDGPSRRKIKKTIKKATKSNVAAILHMSGNVTPRSIAYAAVMLVFNLTDATQWTETYNGFNFRTLWNFIVDYFEETPDDASANRVKALLKWWNKQVFPQHVSVSADSRKARKKLALQRALGRV
ncbi:hypothetical protein BJ165DRAFT_1521357 [Panaeolus papilionaceus]|nr:hypothetical protein BJ165DRAFT_1521357 [Panaeolus papilionaceus]